MMNLLQFTALVLSIFLSNSPLQSQTTAGGRVQELELSAIPHLKILLKLDFDERSRFSENLLKLPLSLIDQESDSLLDNIVSQNFTNSKWEKIGKDSFIFDSQKLISHWVISDWNNSGWENFMRFSFEYNSSEAVSEIILTVWENNEWQNVSLTSLTYDVGGNRVERLVQFWDNAEWVNLSRKSNSYTASDLLDVALFQDWRSESWENESQQLQTYVGDTDTLESIVQRSWIDETWLNEVLENYKFDSFRNVIEIERSLFSDLDQEWLKTERDLRTFAGVEYLLESLREKWVMPAAGAGFWKDSLRTQWVVNSIGTILWGINQLSLDNVWTNVSQTTEFTKPQKGYLLHIISEIWEMNTWVNTKKYIYFRESLVSVYDDQISPYEFQLRQNYPNPFNPQTTIGFELPRSSHIQLIVYNLRGEEIIRLADSELNAGLHSLNWDASGNASGIYLYQLKGNGIVITKKMLLLK